MRRKIGIISVVLYLLVFMLVACGKEEVNQENVSEKLTATIVPTYASVTSEPTSTEIPTKPKATKKPQKAKDKETDYSKIVKGDLEANMEEAMKHVEICGKKVTFPMTLEDLGEDFSIEPFENQSEGKEIFGELLYKNEAIGKVFLDTTDIRKIKTEHIHFIQIFNKMYPKGNIKICGVGFNTKKSEIKKLFGKGTDKLGGLTYERENKRQRFTIVFSLDKRKYPEFITMSYEQK